jgi:hypothetical protein
MKAIISLVLFFCTYSAHSQTDSTTEYTRRYLSAIYSTNLENYSGALLILNLSNCGKGTICGSELEKFTGAFSSINDLPKTTILLGSDTTIEKQLNSAKNITILKGTYDDARQYGFGLALHHLYIIKNGVYTLNAVPTKKNSKKLIRALKKYTR